MDKKIVFIIVGEGWTKEMIEKELEAEDYDYHFTFDDSSKSLELLTYVRLSDEVWVFGKCSNFPAYKHAKENNCDIWQMG